MLLMVEKGIRDGICYAICQFGEANTKQNIMIKIKNHYILNIVKWIICMDGQCHESYVPVILFGLKMDLKLMKISLKNEYFLEFDVQ